MRLTAATAGGTPGDYDTDGDLDGADIDALSAAIAAGQTDAQFDLNGNGTVDAADRAHWVDVLSNTYFGDSNLDGEFNSSDFVAVFSAANYETGQSARWDEGDWNGDGLFNSSDFVAAFSSGGYEKGPRPAAVPEPSILGLALIGLVVLLRHSRK